MSVNVGHLEATLGLNNTGLTKGLAAARASMMQAGQTMKRVGRSMSMSLTLPLLAIGGAAVKMAMSFEKSLSKIEGLVGIASDKVAAFKADILSLAGETARAPQELADAMFFITSAGLRGAAAIDVLTMSARAAAAGLGETKVVADLVTSAVNAYGIENLSAAKATDILTAAVREGKAEAVDIASSLGQVLPIASSLGVEFEELGAAVASMTRTGTNAATAAVQLRQIMASLLKPTQQAEEAMEKMDTSGAKLRKQLREKGLISVLGFLAEQMKTNEQAMVQIFPNIRALSGALDIMGGNAEENIAIFERMRNVTGLTDEAFAAAAKTANFEFKASLAELKAEAILLGDKLLPLFKDIVSGVRKGIKWFGNLSESTKRMGLAFAGFMLVLGPIVFAIGGLVSMLGALLGPIGLVVAAVAVLAGGYAYLKSEIDPVVASLIEEKDELNNLITTIAGVNVTEETRLDLIKKLIKDYPDFLKNIDAETVSNEDLAIALLAVNQEYEKRIILAMKEAAIKDLMTQKVLAAKRELEILLKITKAEANLKRERERAGKGSLLGQQTGIGMSEKALRDLNSELVESQDEQARLGEEIGNTEALFNKMLGTGIGALTGLAVPTAALANGLVDVMRGLASFVPKKKNTSGGDEDGFDPDKFKGTGQFSIENMFSTLQDMYKLTSVPMPNIWTAFGVQQTGAITAALKAYRIEQQRLAEDTTFLGGLMRNSFEGMANVITNALNSTENIFQAFGKFFGDFIKGMIIKLVAAAVAALALVAILSLIPGLGGAGAFKGIKTLMSGGAGFGKKFMSGLKLFTGMGSSNAQGLASGGFVTEGGLFQLHKDEMVNLPMGSAVTPANMVGNMNQGPIEIFGYLSGEVIYLSNKEYGERLGNTVG